MKLWITSTDKDKDAKHLESLGISLGKDAHGNIKWEPDPHSAKAHGVPGRGIFRDCEAGNNALVNLNPYWMRRYVWGAEDGNTMRLPNLHQQQYEAGQKAGQERRQNENQTTQE